MIGQLKDDGVLCKNLTWNHLKSDFQPNKGAAVGTIFHYNQLLLFSSHGRAFPVFSATNRASWIQPSHTLDEMSDCFGLGGYAVAGKHVKNAE